MPKFAWALIIGGLATYFVYKSHRAYTWIAAGATVLVAYLLFRRG